MRAPSSLSFVSCVLASSLAWISPAAALAARTSTTSVAASVEDAEPQRQGRVFIDADGLGEGGPVLAGRTTKIVNDALVDEGVTLTNAAIGPELRLTFKLRDGGGYRIEYAIVYDGERLDDGEAQCQLCTEDELVERAAKLSREVAPKLVIPEPEEVPPPVEPVIVPDDPPPDGPKDEPPDDDPIVDDGDADGKLGGMGKAGIGLLVFGTVSAVTGVILVVREPDYFDAASETDMATDIKTTRPPGWAALGVGGAALVTGAVLLGLDRAKAKNKKKKAGASLHPWLGPGGAGLGVTGRF